MFVPPLHQLCGLVSSIMWSYGDLILCWPVDHSGISQRKGSYYYWNYPFLPSALLGTVQGEGWWISIIIHSMSYIIFLSFLSNLRTRLIAVKDHTFISEYVIWRHLNYYRPKQTSPSKVQWLLLCNIIMDAYACSSSSHLSKKWD